MVLALGALVGVLLAAPVRAENKLGTASDAQPGVGRVAVAERTGLVVPLGRWVLREACRQAAAWTHQHGTAAPVSMNVNVAGRQLQEPGFVDEVAAALADAGLPAERLTIEITETAAISDLEETAKFVAALKALGCRVALDAFGAGYTSFRNLRLLGVDMVKIDGSFIQNLGNQAEDELFVRTLIELAKSFGITTVGEWVGDEKTAKMLEKAGVAYMQGYFFGAPELAKPALPERSAG